MRIVGISAGRRGQVSDQAVQMVLDASRGSQSFFSLSQERLLTCEACSGCVRTYRCVQDDGFNAILAAMQAADAIVFAAPDYWDGMNAKGRAFWERICFATRHHNRFHLKGKRFAAIGVSGDGHSEHVLADIERFSTEAGLEQIGSLAIRGRYACYTCGFGGHCAAGGLAEIYDLPVEITAKRIPSLQNQCPESDEPGEDRTAALIELGEKLAFG